MTIDHGVNAGARLDRLPLGRFHRRLLALVAAGMFFDSFDNSMMAGVLAALVGAGQSTVASNAQYISVNFLGLTIGAGLAGLMGDRWGRRFAYQFNLLLFGSMCLLSAVMPSMSWLLAIRFVMGLGLGAEFVAGYGMVTEFIPPARRGRCIALVNIVSSAGAFTVNQLSVLIIPLLGWRAMFAVGGLGALCIWLLRRKLPESPRWLESKGRNDEAERVLAAIEAEAAQGGVLPPVPSRATPPQAKVPLHVLFSRPVVRRTLLAMAINFVVLVCSYSFTTWVPTFFVRQGFTVTKSLGFYAAMSFGALAGPILGFFLSDRIGRRRGVIAVSLALTVAGAIYPFLTEVPAIIFCGFLLVAGMNLAITFGLAAYTPELFPTEYRFRGSGLAQMMGRGGLIFAPYIVVMLFETYGIGGVVFVLSGLYLSLAIVVALFGIETNQQSLEALTPEDKPPVETAIALENKQA